MTLPYSVFSKPASALTPTDATHSIPSATSKAGTLPKLTADKASVSLSSAPPKTGPAPKAAPKWPPTRNSITSSPNTPTNLSVSKSPNAASSTASHSKKLSSFFSSPPLPANYRAAPPFIWPLNPRQIRDDSSPVHPTLSPRRLPARRGRALHRIRRVIQLDDLFRDVGRRIHHRRALRRVVQHRAVPIARRILSQHFHHPLADPRNHVALRVVQVFLEFVLPAFELSREPLAFQGQPLFLFVAESTSSRGQPLLQIVDLLVQILQFFSPRQKFCLHLRRGLLPFRGVRNGCAHVDRRNLGASLGGIRGLTLRQ